MKIYRITDEANTWWAEYRTDGMQNSISEKIVSIRSKHAGQALNPTDISDAMVILGLPNHVGADVSQVGLLAFCVANSMRLLKKYESESDSWLRVSSAKEFLTFSVPGQVGESVITDGSSGSIAVNVTADTVKTALVPTFTVPFGAHVSYPEGEILVVESGVEEIDFTNEVLFKVWDEALTDKDWDITVTNLSKLAAISAFTFPQSSGAATINEGAGTIAIEVVLGTSLAALVPTITKSAGSTVSPLSGVAANFTAPVVYTVTSQDLTVEKEYTVTVTVALA